MTTSPAYKLAMRFTTALLFLISMAAMPNAAGEPSGDTKQDRLLHDIAQLEKRAMDGSLSDEDVFHLGALYYARRDFEKDIYQRNRFAVEAGKYFFRYKQASGLLAQKNIGLFCIDRVRRSPLEGRDPGSEFHQCSIMVSSYFTAEGALKPDFAMECIILEAMADELLYDISNRYLAWNADDLLSLAKALEDHRIVPRPLERVRRALRKNLENRFAGDRRDKDSELLPRVILEGIYLLDRMLASVEHDGEKEALLQQREKLMQSRAGRDALSLKVVDELLFLAERARSVVTAHSIISGSLPSHLDETSFAEESKLVYVESIFVNRGHLAVSLSSSGELPPAMRGQRIVWSLEKQGVRVEAHCSQRTTLKEPSILEALGCSIPSA